MSFFSFSTKIAKFADFCWDDEWPPVIYYLIGIYRTIKALTLSYQSKGVLTKCVKVNTEKERFEKYMFGNVSILLLKR